MFRGFGDWLNQAREDILETVRNVLGIPSEEPEEQVSTDALAPDFPTDRYEIEDEAEDFDEEEEDEFERLQREFEEFDKRADEPSDERYYYMPDAFDEADIRKVRYAEFEDALEFLTDAGMLDFSEIIYFEDEDLWGIAVYYEEPQVS